MILGIYTAGAVEAAILADDREASAAGSGAALESLVSLITQSINEVKSTLADLSLIGVCTGPGSFTGLRIGVAFANSLAQSRGLPIVGVSSYDVAEFETKSYPIVSVARGKVGFYYARITERSDAVPIFLSGSRETIEQAAHGFSPSVAIVGPDFDRQDPGEAALAVAKLARRALERGDEQNWTNIAIDYGQRPNAVLNWEQRQRAPRGGPEV